MKFFLSIICSQLLCYIVLTESAVARKPHGSGFRLKINETSSTWPRVKETRALRKPKNYDAIVEEAKAGKDGEMPEETLHDEFVGTSHIDRRWNYQMSIEMDLEHNEKEREKIESAIYTLQETMQCFRFSIIPAGKMLAPYVDSLYIELNDGCASLLGRQGQQQKLILGRNCQLYGTAMHEIMHALGFFHEHIRPDRDEFVEVKKPEHAGFAIQPNQTYFVDEYDFGSIMHYPLQEDVMIAKPGKLPDGIKVGQRDHLSESDIKRLRRMYPCDNAPKNWNMTLTNSKLENDT